MVHNAPWRLSYAIGNVDMVSLFCYFEIKDLSFFSLRILEYEGRVGIDNMEYEV